MKAFVRKEVIGLARKYLDIRKSELSLLFSKFEQDDFRFLEKKGNWLYGSGTTYGLEHITHLGEQLENAAKAESNYEIEKILDELEDFISNVELCTNT